MYIEKDRKTAGADERTPSHAQYFSWVNNTNEGSTEAQTLINLEYFAYLKRKYGMQLDIYAWDAGNLDGANGTYEAFDSPKLKAQYPRGYAPVIEAAEKIGIRFGVWCGPDGFGDSEESAAARLEQMVSLARDLHFALFKIDAVCGGLSESNRKYFIKMMSECRKYSPDLVLLNHRLDLGEEGEKYATTFLWGGVETYVDVHIGNKICAPHHRAYIMDRGNTPDLLRLTEDHGVCISSCNDYFEDDLIIQAFGRDLILAPEIYGNPWLLRDFEQAHLARIYNLHRRYRDILVCGMIMPEGEFCPKNTVIRGSHTKRFVATGNMSWSEFKMNLRLDMSIGLAPCDKVSVIVHHPYEKLIGEFEYGAMVDIPIEPFRASLVEICDSREADDMPAGCEYEILHENENGQADKIKIVASTGNVQYMGKALAEIPAFDNTLRTPEKLGEIGENEFAKVPSDSVKQLETALFAQDHDSLEARSLKRAGKTAILEVQAARDAFFGQKTYGARGCESRFAFDGNDETFFDGTSRLFFADGGFRHEGGCLRVDLGAEYEADLVAIEYFDPDTSMEPGNLCSYARQSVPPVCDHSVDLQNWSETTVESIETLKCETAQVVQQSVNNFIDVEGRRRRVTYPVNGKIRYFRMPHPLDRIHKIALIKVGRELQLRAPRANNLLPYKRKVEYAKETAITVRSDAWRDGCYLSVCLEGEHGVEGAYAVLECGGKYIPAPDRSPGYSTNPWEFFAFQSFRRDHHYTYYFPVSKEMCDKEIKVRVLGVKKDLCNYGVQIYLCDENKELDGIEIEL